MIIIAIVGTDPGCADRLPEQVPENQQFDISTMIDATGIVDDETGINWIIAGKGAEATKHVTSNPVANAFTHNDIAGMRAAGAIVTAQPFDAARESIISIIVPKYAESNRYQDSIWGMTTLQSLITYLDNSLYFVSSDTTVWDTIPTGMIQPYQELSTVTYSDQILTSGGRLTENKNFRFDSRNKASGMDNLDAGKVLTYTSTDGAHLAGEESLILDTAGGPEDTSSSIRCVFASSTTPALPAFCNIVTAKSALINMNSGQVSTRAQVRSVANSADIPAGFSYQIAVTPDTESGYGIAEGSISTTIAGHILEARGGYSTSSYNRTAADNQWSDSTAVTGGIRTFQKTFTGRSGFRL